MEHVSFTIRPGESIGLVGKTGSGKTTLVDLILRTYNVNDGQLFLDGRDVNDLSIRSVRDACAYVPQDNFLFSDTIENNIAFGKSETVSEEIRRAAKLADIDGNISEFQMGYQTVLGERGVTVSGGQKQRISIARALMKDAPILILDDSVSAVDTKTEKAILDNLRATRRARPPFSLPTVFPPSSRWTRSCSSRTAVLRALTPMISCTRKTPPTAKW